MRNEDFSKKIWVFLLLFSSSSSSSSFCQEIFEKAEAAISEYGLSGNAATTQILILSQLKQNNSDAAVKAWHELAGAAEPEGAVFANLWRFFVTHTACFVFWLSV